MKAEDLMIGDWVLWHDKYVQIASVSGITYSFGQQDVVLAHCNKEQILEKHITKSIQPIPITAEILEKYGFIQLSDGWIWLKDSANQYQNYICIRFRHNGEVRDIEVSFVNKCHCTCRDIFNVHELQHALKFCGIDKEIQL